MKNRKLICLIVVSIIGGLIWWNIATPIVDISPTEVSKIEFFDGNTGKSVIITDAPDIKQIIENLNAVPVKKEKVSSGYMGYSIRTTIYKTDGTVYKKFIINSSNTIRKDPFFYRASSDSIDYNYIQELIDHKAR